MIIALEGGEGVGKSTQARRLYDYLTDKGRPVLPLREPGGSALSEEIRHIFLARELDPMSELLLVLAARRRNLIELIEPALEAGKIVIVDRFVDSTLVYQGLAGGLGRDKVETLMQLSGTWRTPNLTLVLDMAPEEAVARVEDTNRFDRRESDFHHTIRNGFLQLAREPRHRLVDAARPADRVFETIRKIVDRHLSIEE